MDAEISSFDPELRKQVPQNKDAKKLNALPFILTLKQEPSLSCLLGFFQTHQKCSGKDGYSNVFRLLLIKQEDMGWLGCCQTEWKLQKQQIHYHKNQIELLKCLQNKTLSLFDKNRRKTL